MQTLIITRYIPGQVQLVDKYNWSRLSRVRPPAGGKTTFSESRDLTRRVACLVYARLLSPNLMSSKFHTAL